MDEAALDVGMCGSVVLKYVLNTCVMGECWLESIGIGRRAMLVRVIKPSGPLRDYRLINCTHDLRVT